jgi:hypothetical protein
MLSALHGYTTGNFKSTHTHTRKNPYPFHGYGFFMVDRGTGTGLHPFQVNCGYCGDFRLGNKVVGFNPLAEFLIASDVAD